MEMWTSLLIVLAVFALGDVISILTKARISVLVCHYDDLPDPFPDPYDPPDIVKRAGLGTLGPLPLACSLLIWDPVWM